MTDFASALREIAEPRPPKDRTKVAIGRVAQRIGLSYWRAFDIWYGKARRVGPDECVRINEALEKRRKEALHHEIHDIKLRIALVEARLSQAHANPHRRASDP
jgi:hypothetical protein